MTTARRALLVASSIALAATVTGCAMGGARDGGGFAGRLDQGNVGLALRAQAALQAGNEAEAVRLAERAVENSPTDAGFRTVLGNAYLASGRFRSAEAAFADALALVPGQAGVPLKLILSQVAQGKADAALASLDRFAGQVDPADAGLALALAGRPGAAIELLDQTARSPGADARVRQNLALAHALAGDWVRARSVAAQDVPGDQLEARMAEWAALARPAQPGAQVANLIGVSPAAADAGQPARLALKSQPLSARLAEAAPAPQAAAAPVPAPVEPVAVVEAAPSSEAPIAVAEASAPTTFSPDVAEMVDSVRREPVRASGELPKVAQLRRSAARRFNQSRAVVQLGAFGSESGVRMAWSAVSKRHRAIRAYVPASARFASPKGTVYRLSLKGFASDREARSLCGQLKASGAACFVRNAAGDAPVRFASR